MSRAAGSPPIADLVESAPLSDGVRALARRGELRRYAKGTVLINEGDHGDTVFILIAGRIKVSCVDDKGREVLAINPDHCTIHDDGVPLAWATITPHHLWHSQFGSANSGKLLPSS